MPRTYFPMMWGATRAITSIGLKPGTGQKALANRLRQSGPGLRNGPDQAGCSLLIGLVSPRWWGLIKLGGGA